MDAKKQARSIGHQLHACMQRSMLDRQQEQGATSVGAVKSQSVDRCKVESQEAIHMRYIPPPTLWNPARSQPVLKCLPDTLTRSDHQSGPTHPEVSEELPGLDAGHACVSRLEGEAAVGVGRGDAGGGAEPEVQGPMTVERLTCNNRGFSSDGSTLCLVSCMLVPCTPGLCLHCSTHVPTPVH